MLKTVWLTNKTNSVDGCVMLLGGFDGLHVGHKALFSRAKSYQKTVGVMSIVGAKGDKSLYSFLEREHIFASEGADFVFELNFEEIKGLSPEKFIELLKENFNPSCFVCGTDFRFGYKAQGDVQTLKECGQVCVDAIPLVEVDGEKVSSTRIKQCLQNGAVAEANTLLSQTFFVLGEVFADRKLGRNIGFPTANICYPEDKFPIKQGVYHTQVQIDGKTYTCVTNYGARPTYNNDKVLTETHVIGFDGNLYGKTLKVEFLRYLRDIQPFESVELLKEQLKKDVRRAMQND